MTRFTPSDLITAILLLGAFILIALGHNGKMEGIIIAIALGDRGRRALQDIRKRKGR